MSGKIFFHQLHRHARALERHSRLSDLLEATMQVASGQAGGPLPSLQREFLLVEIGFAYCHFGVSLFSREGVTLLKKGVLASTGIDPGFLERYLHFLKEFLLQQDSPLGGAEEWLDEDCLSQSFLYEFLKRIFCSTAQDDFDVCLNLFEAEMVSELRLLAGAQSLQGGDLNALLERAADSLPNFEKFQAFFFYHLARVQEDPLIRVRWRLESFISFAADPEAPLLIYRDPLAAQDARAQKLSAIMMLLFPQESEKSLVPPLSVTQMTRLLPHSGGGAKAALAQTLEDGVALNVLFRVPQGAGNAYGLTERGLKVVGPLYASMFSHECRSSAPQKA